MDRVLQFPTIWLPRGFNREKRVHESRIGVNGSMSGGMQSTAGVESQLLGANTVTDFLDNFATGSPPQNLDVHTPDIGTSWLNTTPGNWVIDPSGNLFAVGGGGGPLTNPGPGAANYTVTVKWKQLTATGDYVRVKFRAQDETNNYYGLRYVPSTPVLEFERRLTGSTTLLATYTPGNTVGTVYTFACKMVGSTLTVYMDGVAQTPVTDTTFSTAGSVYLFANNTSTNTTKLHTMFISITRP